jgi:hypothetical protein
LLGLEINAERLRGITDYIKRLAATALAARSASTVRSLGNTGRSGAVTIVGAGNRELLNL